MLIKRENKPLLSNLFDELFRNDYTNNVFNHSFCSKVPAVNILEDN